jgi:hypothetical protein
LLELAVLPQQAQMNLGLSVNFRILSRSNFIGGIDNMQSFPDLSPVHPQAQPDMSSPQQEASFFFIIYNLPAINSDHSPVSCNS